MTPITTLKDIPVLVTGATGFIGSHLAERLARVEGAVVTGTGRNLEQAAFLRDAGVTLQKADLLNRDEMAAAIAGKDIVFHVAAWLSERTADDEMAYRINVEGARELVEISAENRVKRIVLVSTIAAYGPPPKIKMDEYTPLDPTQADLYGRTKAIGEQLAVETAAHHGIELSVVRPGMVYGPRSYAWSTGMLNMVKKGVPTLFGQAKGHAFPIYIDNLLDMLVLAAVTPEAAGEAFNAVDPPIDWNQFFGYYGEMAGRKPRRIPMPMARVVTLANKLFKLGLPITKERLGFYETQTVYPVEKAQRLLGYEPVVGIDEGMKRTATWMRETGLI